MNGAPRSRRRLARRAGSALAIVGALPALWPAPAVAEHGATYNGHYGNAFVVGRATTGVEVAVMGGFHTDFPYHDPGSGYDQVAVQIGGAEPIVLTARPKLPGFKLELEEKSVRLVYESPQLAFDLLFDSVRHTNRYEGDPAKLGDYFIQQGIESPTGESPGFIYTPFELRGLRSASLRLRGRELKLRSLHGQAEEGRIDSPTDAVFRSAYDYLAAPTRDAGEPYTYVGFLTHSLHSGADGALDSYFRESGSDEFTMEKGTIADGNGHAVSAPFDNTGALPPGAENLGQFSADLGPGILYRKLVRLRDKSGRGLLVLSETIKEDTGKPDAEAPAISAARARPARLCLRRSGRCPKPGTTISLRLSEDALVTASARGSSSVARLDAKAGEVRVRFLPRGLAPGSRTLLVRATDELGNRSRAVRLKVRVR